MENLSLRLTGATLIGMTMIAHGQLVVTNEQFLPGTNASYTTIENRNIVPGEDFTLNQSHSDTHIYLLNEQTTEFTLPTPITVQNYDGSPLEIKAGSDILSLLYHFEPASSSRNANIQFDVEVPAHWWGAGSGAAAGFGSSATTAELLETDFVSPGNFWGDGSRGMEGVSELPIVTNLGGGKYRLVVNARASSCCMDEMRIIAVRQYPGGYYNGLIEHPSPTTLNTGLARITVNQAQPSFSALFYFHGRYYKVRGRFDANWTYSGTVSGRAGYPDVEVKFGLTFNSAKNYKEIQGSIVGPDGQSTFSAPIAPHLDPDLPAAEAGQYTALTEAATSPDTNTPGGYGYLIGDVTSHGRLHLTGRAGDAMTIGRGTASVYMIPDKTVPFFMNTNYFVDGAKGQRASMTGTLTFRNQAGVSDFDGKIDWYKPESARSFRFRHYREYYAKGFTMRGVTMLGSRYDSTRAIGATKVSIDGANLDSAVSDTASFAPAASSFGGDTVQMRKWYPQTGWFSGRYIHPGMETPRGKAVWSLCYGVSFQKQDIAVGMGIGMDEVGPLLAE